MEIYWKPYEALYLCYWSSDRWLLAVFLYPWMYTKCDFIVKTNHIFMVHEILKSQLGKEAVVKIIKILEVQKN